ncbi:MAG TPA: SLBB domain-containing protein, partial [Burkholderiales bacterium]|nr:SLBB domain-containing protein [Burkholderiales bacterium]
MQGNLPSIGGIPSLQSGNSQGLARLCTPDAIAQNPLLARKCSQFSNLNQQGQGQVNELLPALAETEFQKFVKDTTGEELPLYGYSMFDSAPGTFAPVEGVPVTSDYALGPGDEVVVKIWGQLDADLHLRVDRDGAIYIPKVGSVNVAGIRFQDLRGYLKEAIGKYFRNFDLAVNMGQLRSIQVYVVGQARRPGNYTVSSLSTLVTALFASGGPSSTGSMRHIQLKRGGKVVTEFDLYDFLLKGDKSKDMPLLPGDVIYIPPAGPVAAIAGSVKNPAIYELRDSSDLANLIEMAGGLTTTAAGQKVQVDRIDSHKDRMVQDFALDKKGLSRTIRDGDLVRVFSISPRFENAVTLRGNVAYPFRTAWKKGMRVTDLIPDRDVLVTKDYWLTRDRMHIETKVTKIEALNHNLQSSTDRSSKGRSSTDLSSTDKNSKEKSASMWLQGELGHSLAGIDWDYAVIERFDWKTLRTNLIPFNLGRAVLDRDPSQNLELEPGDVVTVFSVDEMKIPVEKQTKLVAVEGEVQNSGIYQARPGETLRQLVQRIGGFTPDAYLFGAVFTRESTRKLQQQRLEESINRMEQDIARSTAAAAQGTVNPQGVEAAKVQAQTQQAMLEKMKQVKATG